MSNWQIACLMDGAVFIILQIATSHGWIKTEGKKGEVCMVLIAFLLLCMILPITTI